VIAAGCGGSDEEVGRDLPSGGSSGSAGNAGFGADAGLSLGGIGGSASGGAASGGAAGSDAGGCQVTKCQNHVYACGNCKDDDGDGKIDMEDPDCLGPCHDAENTYYGSIPGQAGPACTVDCYFDSDSGPGNDDCHWNHRCDPLSASQHPPEGPGTCAYDPNANTPGTGERCGGTDAGSGLYENQSATCLDKCGSLTPNGCDCFGCCELPAGTGKYVWLGSETNKTGTCTRAGVNDPEKCHPCTPVKGCLNTCEKCELCLGKETLPAECAPKTDAGAGGTGGTNGTCYQLCSSGLPKCGNGCGTCEAGYFCLNGCCESVPE
jgi:hypothetical protein